MKRSVLMSNLLEALEVPADDQRPSVQIVQAAVFNPDNTNLKMVAAEIQDELAFLLRIIPSLTNVDEGLDEDPDLPTEPPIDDYAYTIDGRPAIYRLPLDSFEFTDLAGGIVHRIDTPFIGLRTKPELPK